MTLKTTLFTKRAEDNSSYTGFDFYDEKTTDLGFFEILVFSVSASKFEKIAS